MTRGGAQSEFTFGIRCRIASDIPSRRKPLPGGTPKKGRILCCFDMSALGGLPVGTDDFASENCAAPTQEDRREEGWKDAI